MSATITVKCPRCGGSGRVMRFGHIAKGLCFKCSGAGEVKAKVHRDGSLDHDHRIGWPVEDRCVVAGCGLPISEWPPVVTGQWWPASDAQSGQMLVYVQRFGRGALDGNGELFRLSGDSKRKVQNEARRRVLADIPNARIKWVTP